ncbi:MAG: ABC transporter ATP-binding protein [Nitrososphaerota archaeon]|nr:ABC transporter ATP-binding protein [Nitrososphaerota archaeon]
MSKLILENVVKYYKNFPAVDDVNLKVKDGEFCVIIGPSGSGKTTLLNIIAGFVKPDKGNVLIDGRRVNDLPPRERGIGMVFQEPALFSHLTVKENIAFGLKVRGFPNRLIEERVNEIAIRMGIAQILNQKASTLSGGEAQRVALARALIIDPNILLLDEPLANLDAELRRKMLAELKLLHMEMKKTIVYVTHDQEQALALADKVIIMRSGKVMQVGAPRDVYDLPDKLFVAEFFGTTPMNLISGELIKEGEKILFECGSLRVNISEPLMKTPKLLNFTKIILAIRPEYIKLMSSNEETGYKCDGYGRVSFIENLGKKSLVYLDIRTGERLTVSCKEYERFKPGEIVTIQIDKGKILFFNPSTEERVYP